MAKSNLKISESSKSVLMNIDKISKSVGRDDVQVLISAIDKEVGARKLKKEEVEQLQQIMSVDALEAIKWKNVADVLKYISIFALAENNPEVTKKVAEVLLNIVGLFFPIANTAQGLLTKVPDKLFSALIKIGGFASPDYLIYRGASMIASRKTEKAKTQAEQSVIACENMKSLIIVCKSKLLGAEISKLIATENAAEAETGTIHAIIWNEAAWEAFRHKLTAGDKVLIIGKIKNTMPLTQEQTRFAKYGVTYGWNNNIAMIQADATALRSAKRYEEFHNAMSELEISDKLKKHVKFKFDWVAAGKLAIFPPLLIGDLMYESTAVKKQQLMFGLYRFYLQDLARFLETEA